MIVVLAEKPSVARDIATFLGCGHQDDGFFAGNGYQVTWAFGHLVELQEPGAYDPRLKRWQLETLPFIPERFKLQPTRDQRAGKQLAVIKRLFKAAERLICATDAGREGELIFRYILEQTGCTRKPFDRLWLSSLTSQALRQGFQNLRPGCEFDCLYQAARCRSQADWIVGLNATRAYTVRYGRSQLWSVGRVQTPVLAMIVRRDDEIRHFQPEPFYELITRYRETDFTCTAGRFKTVEEARERLEQVSGVPFQVTKIQQKRERLPPPLLYDLTQLQRDMNKRFALAAAETLAIAQKLYEAKVITYPRTDSVYLSSDMKSGIPRLFKRLRQFKPEEISRLALDNLPFSRRIINDAGITDHHAIIPTGAALPSMPAMSLKVYEAIVLRLIAAFYPPCQRDITQVFGQAAETHFRTRGIHVVDPGWMALYPRRQAGQKKDDERKKPEHEAERELPAFREGESGPHKPSIRDGLTKPPKHFTEASLLGAMETAGRKMEDEAAREAMKDRGLGTPATRAAIIETLLTRSYIVRQKKNLLASPTGRALIALIRSPQLKSPEMTGDWEARLNQIYRANAAPETFMADIQHFIQDIIDSVRRLPSTDPACFGDCPRCGKPVIRGRRGYGCSGWREGCPFVLWPEYKDARLTESQIRTLIQDRLLPQPVAVKGGAVFLALDDYGEIIELTEKTDKHYGKGKGRKSSGGKGRRLPAGATGKKKSRRPSPGHSQTDGRNSPAGAGTSIGICPLCGKKVKETPRAYTCTGRDQGCPVVIWKIMAGKSISKRSAGTLLSKGKTSVLKGFKSKKGNPFDAALELRDGKVQFLFPDTE